MTSEVRRIRGALDQKQGAENMVNLLNSADLFPSAALPLFLAADLLLIDVHLLAPLHRRSHPGHELQVSHPPSFDDFVQLARTSKIVLGPGSGLLFQTSLEI